MIESNITHLIYTPKDTLYLIVSRFKHLKLGNIIGYASIDGDVYFRLEDDFEKFEALTTEAFSYREKDSFVDVKLKLNGTWEHYSWKGRQLITFEEHIDNEIESFERQLNKSHSDYYNKHKYHYNIKAEDENILWKKAKETKFNELEFKQQKIILLKEKIKIIKNELNH